MPCIQGCPPPCAAVRTSIGADWCLPAGRMLMGTRACTCTMFTQHAGEVGPHQRVEIWVITSQRARLPEHIIAFKLNCSSTGNQLVHFICRESWLTFSCACVLFSDTFQNLRSRWGAIISLYHMPKPGFKLQPHNIFK